MKISVALLFAVILACAGLSSASVHAQACASAPSNATPAQIAEAKACTEWLRASVYGAPPEQGETWDDFGRARRVGRVLAGVGEFIGGTVAMVVGIVPAAGLGWVHPYAIAPIAFGMAAQADGAKRVFAGAAYRNTFLQTYSSVVKAFYWGPPVGGSNVDRDAATRGSVGTGASATGAGTSR